MDDNPIERSDRLVGTYHAAKALGCSQGYLRTMIRKGYIRAVRHHGTLKIRLGDLEMYISRLPKAGKDKA